MVAPKRHRKPKMKSNLVCERCEATDARVTNVLVQYSKIRKGAKHKVRGFDNVFCLKCVEELTAGLVGFYKTFLAEANEVDTETEK